MLSHKSFPVVALSLIYAAYVIGQFQAGKYRIVVSHFNEPIEHLAWLYNYTYTLYSRSDCGESYGLYLTPLMENVGREGFVYLQHIVRNFDKLDEITIFLQADVAIDSASILQDAINELIAGYEAFQIYGFLYVLPSCLPSHYASEHFMPKLLRDFRLKYHGRNVYQTCIIKLISLLFRVDVSKPMFTPCGAFAVSRTLIHRHPISYYVALARRLGTENSPAIGYFYERTWSYLFGSDCKDVRGCNYFDLCR